MHSIVLSFPFGLNPKKAETWFLVTFNIIISHIFPENFVETPEVVQKI